MNTLGQSLVRITAVMLLSFVLSPSEWSQTRSQTPKRNRSQPTEPKQNKAGQEIDADDVIRINTTMVNSPVLVIGRNGKFVPNLRREDFQIFEDGVPQEIAHFSTVEKPFTVALLIDTSRSTSFNLQDVQDAALSFVDKMRPNDQALVISFAEQIKVLAEPTSDHELLKRAIRSLRSAGNSRLYDAISFALTNRVTHMPGRTALIIFSDGVDNDSVRATYESSLQLIRQSQTLIFPIQFNTYDFATKGQARTRVAPKGSGFSREDYLQADTYLHQAAEIAGTGVFPAQDINDLNSAVSSISDELHNEYSIGYYPRNPIQPGVEKRIEVRTILPQLVVRARASYSTNPTGTVDRLLAPAYAATSSLEQRRGSLPIPRTALVSKMSVAARWICKGPESPTNLVVVQEGYVAQCPKSARPNDETNAWFVRKPEAIETMCKGFMMWRGRELTGAPIPTGYVVTSETSSPVCSKSTDPKRSANAWVIQQPLTTDTVCKGFPLPRGYVMVSEKFVQGCPATPGGKNAWTIRPK